MRENEQNFGVLQTINSLEDQTNDPKDNSIQLLMSLKNIIFNINENNISSSVQQSIDLFDSNFPYSFNNSICIIVYAAFSSRRNEYNIYFTYLKEIKSKEEDINNKNLGIFDIFGKYVFKLKTQEAYFLLEKMIRENLIEFTNFDINTQSGFFAIYKKDFFNCLSRKDFINHKKCVKEGVNPNEIAKIIRNDDIEKLQEISSQPKFDFNQIIEPSPYERCSFINQENVLLIDYAAFFSSVKCFKYLLMNGAKLDNTGKYAIAGGNEEIIHLCEQNHSSFEDAYEAAIKYHKNDIFKYLYENNSNSDELQQNDYNKMIDICIKSSNFEILFFLENETQIDNSIINETAKMGNLYLVKHFIEKNQIPKNILVFSLSSDNTELVKFILLHNEININAKDLDRYTALILASKNGYTEIVKLLLEQEGIDINAKDYKGQTALIYASKNGYKEIVKLLLEQKGIDINAKDYDGRTALIIASKKGHTEIAKLLLEQKKIDINAKDDGQTALMKASSKGHTEIVKLLLEQEGIDINAKDRYGKTSLMFASENGHSEIIKLLLEQKGIDKNK